MQFELAEKLKNAGFPQEGKPHLFGSRYYVPEVVDGKLAHIDVDGSDIYIEESNEWNKNKTYIPTLSELIDACGEKFNSLRKIFLEEDFDGLIGDAWMTETGESERVKSYYYGKTKKEAVANLYLEINKNDS